MLSLRSGQEAATVTCVLEALDDSLEQRARAGFIFIFYKKIPSFLPYARTKVQMLPPAAGAAGAELVQSCLQCVTCFSRAKVLALLVQKYKH